MPFSIKTCSRNRKSDEWATSLSGDCGSYRISLFSRFACLVIFMLLLKSRFFFLCLASVSRLFFAIRFEKKNTHKKTVPQLFLFKMILKSSCQDSFV